MVKYIRFAERMSLVQLPIQTPYDKAKGLPLLSGVSPLICNAYMRLNQDILLNAFAESASSTRDLLIVHPHTRQLLEEAVVCAGLSSVFEAEVDIELFFRPFRKNALVIYKNTRYRFIAVSGDFCILQMDKFYLKVRLYLLQLLH